MAHCTEGDYVRVGVGMEVEGSRREQGSSGGGWGVDDEQCQWLPHILDLYCAVEDRVRVRCFKSIYPV